MFDEDKAREISKELTLLLMYLNRFTDSRRSDTNLEFYAWKGYDFNVLDKLDEEDYIRQGSHRSKSAYLTKEGIKKAQELLEKYMAVDLIQKSGGDIIE
ncbi:hypothetical protein FUSO6_08525 [Fusobacterium necrophorum DAB]|uniref:DUF6429 family protein n=1 Tax=Fusobacterium necrophorum TaxID=859 RepID=UPI000460DA34|nr:DUF6429 family protein [Fusobacterium necrophorum]KDE68609.1 hypothetical protein FUSO6_08525 [Fusobacterium necrophorum DAB]